jgi:hypothetical protein
MCTTVQKFGVKQNKSDTIKWNEMKGKNVQIKIDSSEKNCEELRMPSPF